MSPRRHQVTPRRSRPAFPDPPLPAPGIPSAGNPAPGGAAGRAGHAQPPRGGPPQRHDQVGPSTESTTTDRRTRQPADQNGGLRAHPESTADHAPLSGNSRAMPRAKRRLFTSLRGWSPLPYRAQISPFRAALSAPSAGGVVRHLARLVPVRIACDRERSGAHCSARRVMGPGRPGRRSICCAVQCGCREPAWHVAGDDESEPPCGPGQRHVQVGPAARGCLLDPGRVDDYH